MRRIASRTVDAFPATAQTGPIAAYAFACDPPGG
jgi:hypothetical protein